MKYTVFIPIIGKLIAGLVFLTWHKTEIFTVAVRTTPNIEVLLDYKTRQFLAMQNIKISPSCLWRFTSSGTYHLTPCTLPYSYRRAYHVIETGPWKMEDERFFKNLSLFNRRDSIIPQKTYSADHYKRETWSWCVVHTEAILNHVPCDLLQALMANYRILSPFRHDRLIQNHIRHNIIGAV